MSKRAVPARTLKRTLAAAKRTDKQTAVRAPLITKAADIPIAAEESDDSDGNDGNAENLPWSGNVEELVAACRALAEALDNCTDGRAVAALTALRALGTPPRDVLAATRAASAVAQARNCAATAARATALLTAWTGVARAEEGAAPDADDDAAGRGVAQPAAPPAGNANLTPVRRMCVKLLSEPLHGSAVALQIEAALCARHGGDNDMYRMHCRSIVYNLWCNAAMCAFVLDGTVAVDALCAYSPAEMLTDERRAEAEAEAEHHRLALLPTAGAQAQRTDEYKCPRCHGRDCTFFQVQTRSADEPMTIFVTCERCGKRFRR